VGIFRLLRKKKASSGLFGRKIGRGKEGLYGREAGFQAGGAHERVGIGGVAFLIGEGHSQVFRLGRREEGGNDLAGFGDAGGLEQLQA